MKARTLAPAAALAAVAALGGTAAAVTRTGPVRTPLHTAAARPPALAAQLGVLGLAGFATDPATAVGPGGATLNGAVLPNGWAARYHFVWGTTKSYGHSAPASDAAVTGATNLAHQVSQTLTGLAPATTYHYRIVVTFSFGAAASVMEGADQAFTTSQLTSVQPPVTTPTTATTPTTPVPTPTPTTPTTATTPTTPAPAPAPPPVAAPVVGQTAVAGTVSGTVSVTRPGTSTPVALGAGQTIPLGSVIDASSGVVRVTNALAGAATQTATVWAGRFTMSQTPSGRTILHPVGAPACPAGRSAHAAARAVRLWARDHHGRYGTRGRNSVATVRGTVWETVESCAGTRTVVRRGAVSVRDLHSHRSVVVRAGHSLLVRP